MTININTVKIGDRVVITDQAARRNYSTANDTLEPGKVYTIGGVHKQGNSGGTVSIVGEFNQSAPVATSWGSDWHPGSFGFCMFKKAPEPVTLEGATVAQVLEELARRGFSGTLSHEVTSIETITL